MKEWERMAFPSNIPVMVDHPEVEGALTEGGTQFYTGMTLRDYFAAKAMVALMSNDLWVEGLDNELVKKGEVQFKDGLAAHCYLLADAMLKAREA